MKDIFHRLRSPQVLADNAGSGLLIRAEIIDTPHGKAEPTGAYAHLTMSAASAMDLLKKLQAMRDLHGWRAQAPDKAG